MGIFDRLREGMGLQGSAAGTQSSLDDQAIARYRYLLKTAPPETIERAHAEAFAQLSPEQRRRVLQELGSQVPEAERAAVLRAGDNPGELARSATRAEIRQPGVMERVFGGLAAAPGGAVPGMGGLFASTLLSSMAGTVLGSMIAQQFFHADGDGAHFGESLAHDRGVDHSRAGSDDVSGFDSGSPDVIDDIGNIDTWDV